MQAYEKEEDWFSLIGQQESARLELKSPRIFERKEKAIEDLSQEASAFANSEGGVILIGIEENRGKTRKAEKIAGLDPSEITSEWLQQVIESNISPFLPGIRVFQIRLSRENTGKVGYSIVIPKGTTAYQAKDFRYYGRSEYERKALPDHEVRLQMMRGHIAQATMLVGKAQYITATKHNENLKAKKEAFLASGHIWRGGEQAVDYDRYLVQLEVLNTSDITISDFILELQCESPFLTQQEQRSRHRFAQPAVVRKNDFEETAMPPKLLFPRDHVPFPSWGIHTSHSHRT